MGPVFYCPGHSYNTISSCALKYYFVFQRIAYEPLEHCVFFEPQRCSWIYPYHNWNNLDHLQIKIVKVKPERNRNIVAPSICGLLKRNLSQRINQNFVSVSITGLIQISRKGLITGLPTNISDLEEPCHICIFTKSTKMNRGLTIDVS